ncbi:MAG: NFYB/HAP3 family transcription factor subunit [Nanoarchaeota archaeon]|nr:NFYB/HAP3 family transcription factor subunit [Candidatus Woesearchaeota archaeon]MBU2560770.1 NFYB/HAP3 family transcription factor subunit [Nanoarchaeota archaeon]
MPKTREHVIPLAIAERILKNAGAARVSEEAKVAFSDVLREIAEDIGNQAARISKHAGRKTVQEEDIKLAAK